MIYLQHPVLRDPARMAPFGIVSEDRFHIFSHRAQPTLMRAVDNEFFSPLCGFYLILDNCKAFSPAWLFQNDWGPSIHATPLSAGGINSLKQVGVTIREMRDGKPVGNPCCIYHLSAGDPWGIGAARSPDVAAQAWCLASYALEVQLRFSPSYTGLVILREELQRWGDLPEMSAAWRAKIFGWHQAWAHPFAWARDTAGMFAPDADTVTIYKFDRNMSYVSSAGEVPVGNPEHIPMLIPGKIGVYRISAQSPDDWPADMPGPFYTGTHDPYPTAVEIVWAWEPQIRLAIRQGWTITIHDGYVWREKHDLLRTWRERIWKARRQVQTQTEADMIADGIIKRVGVTAIGRLRQSRGHAMIPQAEAEAQGSTIQWYERDGAGQLTGMVAVETATGRDDLYRPEWWCTTIANAAEREQNAIYDLWERHPIAGWVDAVYCIHDDPRYHASPMQPGKFKHAGTITAPLSEIPTQAQPFVSWYAAQKRGAAHVG